MINSLFDYVVENIQETAEKVKSEDEIERWSTDDSFNEVRKASYMLQKGFE